MPSPRSGRRPRSPNRCCGRLGQQPERRRRGGPQRRRRVRHGPAAERAEVKRRDVGVGHRQPDRPGGTASSSATSSASAVRVPWPASTLPVNAVIAPSAPTCTQASSGPSKAGPAAGLAATACTTVSRPSGRRRERLRLLARPDPRAALARAALDRPRRAGRRRHGLKQLRLVHQLGGAVHRPPDPRIGTAAADLAGQLGVDPVVVGCGTRASSAAVAVSQPGVQ